MAEIIFERRRLIFSRPLAVTVFPPG